MLLFRGIIFNSTTMIRYHCNCWLVFAMLTFQVTYCNHSQGIIWGVGPQGYKCENCDFNVHKKFVHRYSLEVIILDLYCDHQG